MPGIYRIDIEVNITTDGGIGQVVCELNGVELPETVMGNMVGNSTINDGVLLRITTANSVLRVVVPSTNPSNGPASILVTSITGGYMVPASTLRIIQVAN
jgi:hypothetical protein